MLENQKINEEILINSGFKKIQDVILNLLSNNKNIIYSLNTGKFSIIINNLSNYPGRDWYVHVDNEDCQSLGSADISTVKQFNMLMELLDIDCRM